MPGETVLESIVVRMDARTADLQKGYAEAIKSTQTMADSMTTMMSKASASVGAAATSTTASVAKATGEAAPKVASSGEQMRSSLLAFGNTAKDVSANLGTMLGGGIFGFAKGVGALSSNAAMAIPALQGVAAAINTWLPAIEKAVGGLSGFYKAGVAASESLRKMSASTGLSLQSTFALQHAANLAGFDIDTLSSGISGLNRHLGQALNPSSEAARGLRAIGLDAHEIATMNVDEAMARIGDALKGISNPAERTAASFGAVGRRGLELVPFLMRFSSLQQKAAEDAKVFGNAVDGIDLKNIKEAGEAGKDLKAVTGLALGNLQKSFAASFAPVVKTLNEGLANTVRLLAPVFQVFQGVFRIVGGIVQGVVNAGAAVVRFFQPAFQAVSDVVRGIANVLGSIPEIVGNVVSAIGGVLGDIKDFLQPVLDVVGAIISAPFKLLSKIGQSMKAGVSDFGTQFGGKQLAELKRPEAEKEIKDRKEQIRKIAEGEPIKIKAEFMGQKIEGEAALPKNGILSGEFVANQMQKELDKQMKEMNEKRESTNRAQVEEAKGKIEDQISSLDRQQASLGMTAAAAAKYAAVQDLMKSTGLSAEEATRRLGKALDDLGEKQKQLGIATAVDKLNEQTRALELQTMTLGFSARTAQKYTAVADLMKQTGISTTEAWKQLGPTFERLDEAMKQQAVMEARQKTEDNTRALEVQLATVGMTTEAAAKYTAIMELSKTAGISAAEASERLTRTLDEQGRAQVALDSAKLSQQWRDEAETIGMAAEVAERYRLARRGATEEQLRAVTASAALRQAAENEKTIREVAEKLTEEMRTPVEVFNDRLEELDQLWATGRISAETYGRAVEKAAAQVASMNKELGAIQGVAAGSAAALARLTEFQDSLYGGPFGRGGIRPLAVPVGSGATTRFEPGVTPAPQPSPAEARPAQPSGLSGEGFASGAVLEVLKDIRDALINGSKKSGRDVRVWT